MKKEKNVVKIPLYVPIAIVLLITILMSYVLELHIIANPARYNNATNALTTEDGKFEYEVQEDETIEITKYKGKETEVDIPETIDGKTVVYIDWEAFEECINLKEITIPKSIIYINSWIFRGCVHLKTINVSSENQYYSSVDGILYDKEKTTIICYPPKKEYIKYTILDSVTTIEGYAFADCKYLTQITIPEGVKTIFNEAFYGCSNLTEINIPQGVTSISADTFNGCKSLKNIILPEGITEIGSNAFANCTSLMSINIPQGVTTIEYYAFSGCTSLKEISLPEGIASIKWGTFGNCTSLMSINIPEGVTTIDDGTFYECASLKDINIPEGVTSIGNGAFECCTSLTEIFIPETVTSIGDSAFHGCESLKSINIPEGVTSIEDSTFFRCINLETITLPKGITKIGNDAFGFCETLKDINIPEGVMNIGHSIFTECRSIRELNIPKSIKSIGENVFSYTRIILEIENEGQQEIELPDIIKRSKTEGDLLYTEEDFIFNNCNLNEDNTKLIIDSNLSSTDNISLKIVGGELDGLLVEAHKITDDWNYIYKVLEDQTVEIKEYIGNAGEVIIPETIEGKTVTKISSDAFYFCDTLKSITIHSKVKEIEGFSFSACTNLQEVKILEGITSIGMNAFSGCTNLEKIDIPKGVTTIDDGAFERCTKLKEISIPETVTFIGIIGVFKDCSNLQEINVAEENGRYSSENGILFNKEKTELICYPDGKEETEYIIPEKVTSTGMNAFDDCKNLTKIEILGNLENIVEGSFYNCVNLKEINVADGNRKYSSENGVLFNKEKTELICYPDGKEEEEYIIPEGVTSIGMDAFDDCKNLTNVEMPTTLLNIGDRAFECCENLMKIDVPKGVTKVGDEAFTCCTNLRNIVIPKEITDIGTDVLRLSNILKVVEEGTQEIELPEIMRRTQDQNDVLYNEEELRVRNCELSEDKTKVILNIESLKSVGDASVYSYGGGLELVVIPSGRIAYSENNSREEPVVATLYIAEGERITNNDGKHTYTFTENGGFTFEYIDINGNEKTATARVTNIEGNIPVLPDISKEVESIKVTTAPNKTQYNVHENFDSNGIVVTATYEDGTSEEITYYTIVNGDDLTCQVKEIEIQYNADNAITTKLPITVSHDMQEATCTEPAKCKTEECTYTEGNSLGHSYENGVCTTCGEKEPTINITSDKYEIDDTYVSNIQPKTSIEDFKKQIGTNATEVKIYNKNQELQEDTKTLGTGMKVELKLNDETRTFTIVVKGDASGDGAIKLTDMTIVNRHRLKKKMLEGAYFEAADVTGDGKVDLKDLVKINKFKLNKIAEL